MERSAGRLLTEYLAAAARTGDRAAFGRLVRLWQPKLLGHAWRLTGDSETARDVVQDAWSDVARSLQRLEDAAMFPAWAYRIVSRRAADAINRRIRTRRLAAAIDTTPTEDGAASLDFAADAEPLARAIRALPGNQRATVALFYLEDLSIAEISAAMDVPAGTVKTRLMHARTRLRAALTGEKEHG